jgi:AcrR family transcriptional regulator
MDPRQRIVQAAARVFAETGYRGATTRRIAHAANVNEVTLFRHFRSKEELLREAIAQAVREGEMAELPAEPVRPREELTDWCRRHLLHLHESRSLIRTCMGEMEEHADVVSHATARPTQVNAGLRAYLVRLRERGLTRRDLDVEAAASMLMGAMFGDAMGRDLMPLSYPYALEDAPERYVELFLRTIGAEASAGTTPSLPESR